MEWKEERRAETALGAGEKKPLCLPTPSFMASAEEEQETDPGSVCSFLLFPLCRSL